MGMFDYVKCERVMPDGLDGRETIFQSKDFRCNMDTLEITEDGQLLRHSYDDWSSADKKLLPPKTIDFHGWLHFYEYDKDKVWHEYRAKFTDGRLVEIKLTSPQEE